MSTQPFGGVIGRTVNESTPWWPEPARPPAGSPNIVLVVFDDVGFAQFGCYGSTIATPTLDRLAGGGLRFVNFHTTALCSPTRACLLTGRNHHAVGMRAISNFDTGFPNMRGAIDPGVPTIAEILRDHGYGTAAFGKWHLAPMHETSPAGPFHNWPLRRGFDRFYGFLQGETDQFRPELVDDQHYVDPPAQPEDGYHVTADLVDHAIAWANDQVSAAPDRPFFTYLAFGACHSPHQAPDEYLQRYRGAFDDGWDAARDRWFARQIELGVVPPDTTLPPRNPGVKAWADLTDDERRFAARLQEAFAAFLTHTDAELGRYVEALDRLGVLDDTLFIAMSDNGASQEGGPTGVLDEMRYFNGLPEDVAAAVGRLDTIGGPDSHSNYPWGWAMAGNTPLKRYKQNTHAGGVRDPFIVHWPARIGPEAGGGIRRQFHHATDVTPTILDLLGIDPPVALHGTSMLPVIDDGDAPAPKTTQYFEMFGHRAIYHDGWKAVCYHEPGADYDSEPWELYDAVADVSEAHDLAATHPERLAALVELWWQEAARNDVLPLDDRRGPQLFGAAQRRGSGPRRRTFVLHPPLSRWSADVAPPTGNRSFRIEADLEPAADGRPANGVVVNRGSANGGYVLYVADGHLTFDYNFFHTHTTVRAEVPLPPRRCRAAVTVERNGRSGTATLIVDGTPAGTVTIPQLAMIVSSTGLDVGRATAPVTHDLVAPATFDGVLHTVTFELASGTPRDAAREADVDERVTMGQQ